MRKILRQIVGNGVLTCIVGYASGLLSRTACEDLVARDLAALVRNGTVYDGTDTHVHSAKIIERSGLQWKQCDGPSSGSSCKPVVHVEPAQIRMPFVVSVKYAFSHHEISQMGGVGGRRRFVCVFGFIRE